MSEIRFCPLPDECRPLLGKFYREHQSSMRAASKGQAWVARQAEIVGALCLTPVAEGHWLTGLFVAPAMRGKAVARGLIDAALQPQTGPVWLFCHPDLLGFYQLAGFATAQRLPQTLGERFMRYSRSKPLIALCRQA
ncbi:Acetyltransferase [Pseudomonas caricapapayae]|uniref:Acetyltransferase n=1 Tax=Pseudomonas caricapapayae TaxID=46678 RepID=A0A0P9P9R5_9PSED|nr:GNAT family N-acetyltransferase [Pseudomonas caricapapayae]KAA8696767.1 GNAT family N-acetyltransferase [Pseudomonas caricapapayae]KPW53577.1 Acetyltransferase [Pseudomonas caricapapayae]RMM09132.1 Acetyltransferase [Pseudomonas caricapapayae]RMV72139.1 Acetyltransferase [Pseudomonas caricapapayae]RMV94075.1 Acetyltransferase [Pseudomonas caricapapayae]